MGKSATSLRGGRYRWMWFSAFGWRLKISLRKRDAGSGSSVGSALAHNSGGYVVKADLLRQTHSARTAAAPQPGWTSH